MAPQALNPDLSDLDSVFPLMPSQDVDLVAISGSSFTNNVGAADGSLDSGLMAGAALTLRLVSGGGAAAPQGSPQDPSVNISSCTFTNNTARAAPVSQPNFGVALATLLGSALSISSSGGQVDVSNCSFTGNTGTYDGAVYLTDLHQVQLMACNFTSNVADYGAAVTAVSPVALLVIVSSHFTNNSARIDGGAILINGGTPLPNVTLAGCRCVCISPPPATFSFVSLSLSINPPMPSSAPPPPSFLGNRASGVGGALATYSLTSTEFTAEGCTFDNNIARVCGGGIYMASIYRLTVKGCHFTANEAHMTGGGACACRTPLRPSCWGPASGGWGRGLRWLPGWPSSGSATCGEKKCFVMFFVCSSRR